MTEHDTTGAAPNWTRLHWAVWDGDAGKISRLLEEGADPNARNKDGLTPLHCAAGHGNPATIAALIEAGADPDARDENGYTLLHVVAATVRRPGARYPLRLSAPLPDSGFR